MLEAIELNLLHRRQHEATGRVDHEIDRHIVGRILDRRIDRLGILQIDVPRDGKAEKASPLLTMTRDACDFSIARIACARRTAYHRPVRSGCSTMIAKKIQKSDEKSNDRATRRGRPVQVTQKNAGVKGGGGGWAVRDVVQSVN